MRLTRLFVTLLFFTHLNQLTAQNVTVSGAVSGNGNYSSLSAAFTGIAGSQTGATIVITINASFAEVASATLANNTWTSATIQPSGGSWTITSAFNPLLEFNGADNVTVDGLNSGGNALTLDYSSSSATACTVRFINDATYNTVTRCTIKGSSTGAAGNINDGGVISFSTTNGSTGNDNNTISYCDIGPSGANLPYTCIRSYATNNKGNDNITITNNTIHDFFNGTISANVNTNGIYIVTYASDWTITSNKFYQSATRTFTVGGQASYRTIRVSSGVSDANAGNFNISNNIIGYQNSSGTGYTTIDVNANLSIEFEAIILEAGSSGAQSTISGNTITNIDVSTSRAPVSLSGLTSNGFCGIYASGAVTISNNIIGASSGTGIITIHSRQTTVASTPGVVGIVSRGTLAQTITGNTIGGITVVKHSSATQNTMIFAAIESEGSGNTTISSNTIGNSSTNNMRSDETAGNIIGISLVQTAGTITVSSNTIQNFIHTGLNTATGTNTSVLGISCSSSGGTYAVSQNSISSLSNTYAATSVSTQVAGIYLNQSGSGHTVSGNKIYGLIISNANASAVADGIRISQGTMTISNNMVSIGSGITTNNLLIGVNVKGGTPSLYYNSLVITGSYSGGINSATYAIRLESNLSGTNLVNNILYNTRSTTATSNNVALFCSSSTQVTNISSCNYNNIYWSGTGTSSAAISPTYYSTLAGWQGASSKDGNSISQSVSFVNIANDLHITDDCTISGKATINSVTIDYDNQTRSSFPDIGADEYNIVSWTGLNSSDWSTASNWAPATVPTSTSDVLIPSGTPFSCTISSANGTCRSISIFASASFSIIADKILTLNANCTYGGFANSGSFSPGSGIEEVAFNGLGTVLGTVTFNIVSTNNGLTFGTTTTTVNKKFRIDAGGYVAANPPIYTTGTSTLQYNAGGVYNRSLEWSTASGAGFPYQVQLSNSTILNPGRSDNAYTGVVFNCGSNLTIDAGSSLSMNYAGHNMTVPLTVPNDITINGSLTLSGVTSGDLKVGGNWSRDGSTGTFIPNQCKVTFNSSINVTPQLQTIIVNGGGNETYYNLEENNALGLTLSGTTNAYVTNHLYLTRGLINTSGNEVYVTSNTTTAITFDASNSSADSWVNGYLRRKITTGSYDFPVGVSATSSAAGYELMNLNFTSNTNVDNLLMSFTTDGSPSNEPYNVAVNGTAVNNRLDAGWWTVQPYDASLVSVTSPACNYNVSLYERGHSNSQSDPSQYAVIKRDASYCFDVCATPWTQCGVHVNSTQWESGGTAYAERSGFTCNSFSDWAIGYADIILPIEIATFDVIPDNADVILTWLTSAEFNSDFFGVERSTDGINFSQIGIVKAAGQSSEPKNYSLTDYGISELASSKIYYRLRMVDIDQTFDYSQVRMVDLSVEHGNDEVTVYPNPFSDAINISWWNVISQTEGIIQLIDVEGRIIIQKEIQLFPGTNSVSFDKLPQLSSGVYVLRILDSSTTISEKIIKE